MCGAKPPSSPLLARHTTECPPPLKFAQLTLMYAQADELQFALLTCAPLPMFTTGDGGGAAVGAGVGAAVGTAVGGWGAPWIFGRLIATGDRVNLYYGYLLTAAILVATVVVVLFFGVKAERTSLEDVAEPLSFAADEPAPMATSG